MTSIVYIRSEPGKEPLKAEALEVVITDTEVVVELEDPRLYHGTATGRGPDLASAVRAAGKALEP